MARAPGRRFSSLPASTADRGSEQLRDIPSAPPVSSFGWELFADLQAGLEPEEPFAKLGPPCAPPCEIWLG